jgi:hypothetical protein
MRCDHDHEWSVGTDTVDVSDLSELSRNLPEETVKARKTPVRIDRIQYITFKLILLPVYCDIYAVVV